MKLRYRILNVVALVIVLAFASLALVLSHNSPCGASPLVPDGAARMKAIVARCYGSPDVLRLEEIAKPTAADNEVLVKVHAAALNPLDWHYMRGTPYIMRLSVGAGTPNDSHVGVDFAGTVEAVGKNVTRFKVGDEVFGGKGGAVAEYVAVREEGALALKPTNLTFEQAASVPIAAITALQSLRDKGRIQPGQKVLINGASGGVGSFAVQIAKASGAEVTGVCSTKNVELVRSLGADHVIDYSQADFTQGTQPYDLILDTVGNRSLSSIRRVMPPKGIYVGIGGGGPNDNPWIGAFTGPIKQALLSPFVSQELVTFYAELNKDDLEFLSQLMQAGKLTPVIDQRYALSETAAAMRHLEAGHARGKVVVTLE